MCSWHFLKVAVWGQTSFLHCDFAAFGAYFDDDFVLFIWQEDAIEPSGPS